jgi:hypothetical protein
MGLWRSLVAHLNGIERVRGSNPRNSTRGWHSSLIPHPGQAFLGAPMQLSLSLDLTPEAGSRSPLAGPERENNGGVPSSNSQPNAATRISGTGTYRTLTVPGDMATA